MVKKICHKDSKVHKVKKFNILIFVKLRDFVADLNYFIQLLKIISKQGKAKRNKCKLRRKDTKKNKLKQD